MNNLSNSKSLHAAFLEYRLSSGASYYDLFDVGSGHYIGRTCLIDFVGVKSGGSR
ncbi:MAG: hypothetical protein OSB19_01415 [Opitutaceae bacterium]|nr:hypothetical protein [Opitutaceae bacterium]